MIARISEACSLTCLRLMLAVGCDSAYSSIVALTLKCHVLAHMCNSLLDFVLLQTITHILFIFVSSLFGAPSTQWVLCKIH